MKNYKSIALGCALLLGMSCCLTGCTASGETGNASETKTEQQETIEKANTRKTDRPNRQGYFPCIDTFVVFLEKLSKDFEI